MCARRAYPRFCSAIIEDCHKQLCDELQSLPQEEKADGLCWLSLDYSSEGGTQEVDYSRRAARLTYLLRYFFAYSREYCMMYRDALNLMSSSGSLTVCSLGCGAEVDRWSVLRALGLDDVPHWDPATPLRYHGFDVQDWSLESELLWEGGDDGSAVVDWRDGAVAFADMVERGACRPDIICFPKSAMEIRADEFAWGRVCNAITRMGGNEFCILISRAQAYPSVPFFGNPAGCAALVAEGGPLDIGGAMRDIVMDLICAAQMGGFGHFEMKVVDAATHDARDEREYPDDAYSWERTTQGKTYVESIFPAQRGKIESLHDFCPWWKEGEGCVNPASLEEWRGRVYIDTCNKTDRSPLSIRSSSAEDDALGQFRACYVILHFKKMG